jgi:hypothetical protein
LFKAVIVPGVRHSCAAGAGIAAENRVAAAACDKAPTIVGQLQRAAVGDAGAAGAREQPITAVSTQNFAKVVNKTGCSGIRYACAALTPKTPLPPTPPAMVPYPLMNR